MLKKPITYETFDGETVTEDFYFHLSKSELAEMELSKKGGMEKWLREIIAAEDGATIISEFRKFLLASYGLKSPDGKRFRKSEEISQDFVSSPAFDVLFMEIVTDAQKAAQFVNGVVPAGLAQEMNVFNTPEPENPGPETQAPERRDPTELVATPEQHKAAEKAILDREQGHPSDTAATPAPRADSEGRRILTRQEVTEMPDDELRHLLATGQAVLGE